MPQPIRKIDVSICKVDQKLGLVFGYAIVCKIATSKGWEPYYDTGSLDETSGDIVRDHISEEEMLAAVTDFMKTARVANEMHAEGDRSGTVVHSFPMTSDIADALGILVEKTGWLVAIQPDAEMLAKFASGELKGFSIEGDATRTREAA